MKLIHTCYRIGEIDRSVAFYEALGMEGDRAPADPPGGDQRLHGLPRTTAPRLELTYNFGVDSYELGTGYNHIAITVTDLDQVLPQLAEQGIEPEKPPYTVSRERLAAVLRARPGWLPDRAHRATVRTRTTGKRVVCISSTLRSHG